MFSTPDFRTRADKSIIARLTSSHPGVALGMPEPGGGQWRAMLMLADGGTA